MLLDLATEMGIRPAELGRWTWVEVVALLTRRAELASQRATPGSPKNLLDLDGPAMAAALTGP